MGRFSPRPALQQFHRREHALRIIRQVAGGRVHLLPARCGVRTRTYPAANSVSLASFSKLLHQHRPFGQPQRHAGPDVFRVDRIKPHLRADLPVVALLGLLQHLEIRLKLRLVLESRAVDALELRVLLVPLVIGARHRSQLECTNVARPHHVRPGAQIQEIPVLEVGDRLALRNVRQVPSLNLLALPGRSLKPAEASALGVRHGLLPRSPRSAQTRGWP